MIQATDFICPICKAQAGKSCTEAGAHRFGKPHAERRRLAKAKREQKGSK